MLGFFVLCCMVRVRCSECCVRRLFRLNVLYGLGLDMVRFVRCGYATGVSSHDVFG